jgi:hypothetical protein
LSEENEITKAALKALELRDDESYPRTYEAFVAQLKKIDLELLEEYTGVGPKPPKVRSLGYDDKFTKSGIDDAISNMKSFKANTYYDVIRRMFEPADFKTSKANNMKLPEDCEVYVQGKAVFLPYHHSASKRDQYPETYISMLKEAVEKYKWDIDA